MQVDFKVLVLKLLFFVQIDYKVIDYGNILHLQSKIKEVTFNIKVTSLILFIWYYYRN